MGMSIKNPQVHAMARQQVLMQLLSRYKDLPGALQRDRFTDINAVPPDATHVHWGPKFRRLRQLWVSKGIGNTLAI